MNFFCLAIVSLFLFSCHSKSYNQKRNITDLPSMDSCLNKINIDTKSIESDDFRKFWSIAESQGYTFKDDTSVPFVKVIFKPRTSKFYTDTFFLKDCMVMDSLNIHQMDIFASKAIQKKYYPNLWIEEWEFKNQQSALTYGTALGNFINAGYGLKSPTAILQRGANVFLFQTAAFVSIPELERMIKLLNPNPKMLGRNYDP